MTVKEHINEADDFDFDVYSFLPEEITVNGQTVTDYTGIEHDKIYLTNKKDILTKKRPNWIPEFDIAGLENDSFLPVCVRDSDGNYFVQSKIKVGEHDKILNDYARTVVKVPDFETHVLKMSSDLLAATVDYYLKFRRAEINETKGWKTSVALPRALKSMTVSRYDDMVRLLSYCSSYRDEPDICKKTKRGSDVYHRQNKVVFIEQWAPLLQVIKDKRLDMNLQKQEAVNTFDKGEETSYGTLGRSDVLFEEFGVMVKKQNGSAFKAVELERVKSTFEKVWSAYYGKHLINLARENDLTFSFADNCGQHARKACGLYRRVPSTNEKAIGVSFFKSGEQRDVNKPADTTLAHETAHWLDSEKGRGTHHFFASDLDGTLENKIAQTFKRLIRENEKKDTEFVKRVSGARSSEVKKLGDYEFRTCECLARAMEEQYALSRGLMIFEKNPAYLPAEQFRKEIEPMALALLEENRKHFGMELSAMDNEIDNRVHSQVTTEAEVVLQVYNVPTKTVFKAVQEKLINDGFREKDFAGLEDRLFKSGEDKRWVISLKSVGKDRFWSLYEADEFRNNHKNERIEYLNENLELEIACKASGLKAKSYYNSKDTQKLCHDVKKNDGSADYNMAVEKIASYIASQGVIDENAVLIPAPQHSGKAEYTGDIARVISRLTNASVADILCCKPHDTLYEQKKRGEEASVSMYLRNVSDGFFDNTFDFWKEKGRKLYFIDNNISSGTTFNEAARLIPDLIPAPFAIGNFAEIEMKKGVFHIKNLLENHATIENHQKTEGIPVTVWDSIRSPYTYEDFHAPVHGMLTGEKDGMVTFEYETLYPPRDSALWNYGAPLDKPVTVSDVTNAKNVFRSQQEIESALNERSLYDISKFKSMMVNLRGCEEYKILLHVENQMQERQFVNDIRTQLPFCQYNPVAAMKRVHDSWKNNPLTVAFVDSLQKRIGSKTALTAFVEANFPECKKRKTDNIVEKHPKLTQTEFDFGR